MSLENCWEVIDRDYQEIDESQLPLCYLTNKRLDEMKSRLDRLDEKKQRKFDKHPRRVSSYFHYAYLTYEITRHLIN